VTIVYDLFLFDIIWLTNTGYASFGIITLATFIADHGNKDEVLDVENFHLWFCLLLPG